MLSSIFNPRLLPQWGTHIKNITVLLKFWAEFSINLNSPGDFEEIMEPPLSAQK